MSCNCLEKIRKNLNESEDIIDVELKTSFCLNFDTGVTTEKAGKLNFICREKSERGGFKKMISTQNISFTHCPFCGTKY